MLAGAVAVWWSYFDVREAAAYAVLESPTDPTRAAVRAFNALFVTMAAMIIIAVGDEVVIEHPRGHTSITTVLLVYTGPVLYLGFQAWQARHASAPVPTFRLVGIGALVFFAHVGVLMPPFLAAVGATLPLVVVAVVNARSGARSTRSGRG